MQRKNAQETVRDGFHMQLFIVIPLILLIFLTLLCSLAVQPFVNLCLFDTEVIVFMLCVKKADTLHLDSC